MEPLLLLIAILVGALALALWKVSTVPECYGEHRDDSVKCWNCEMADECREDTDHA